TAARRSSPGRRRAGRACERRSLLAGGGTKKRTKSEGLRFRGAGCVWIAGSGHARARQTLVERPIEVTPVRVSEIGCETAAEARCGRDTVARNARNRAAGERHLSQT